MLTTFLKLHYILNSPSQPLTNTSGGFIKHKSNISQLCTHCWRERKDVRSTNETSWWTTYFFNKILISSALDLTDVSLERRVNNSPRMPGTLISSLMCTKHLCFFLYCVIFRAIFKGIPPCRWQREQRDIGIYIKQSYFFPLYLTSFLWKMAWPTGRAILKQ